MCPRRLRDHPDQMPLEYRWYHCANAHCSAVFAAETKRRGGGTANRLYCCFECQQAVYRRRRRARLLKAGLLKRVMPTETLEDLFDGLPGLREGAQERVSDPDPCGGSIEKPEASEGPSRAKQGHEHTFDSGEVVTVGDPRDFSPRDGTSAGGMAKRGG